MMKDVQTINKYIDAGFLMARKETTNGTRGYFMFQCLISYYMEGLERTITFKSESFEEACAIRN